MKSFGLWYKSNENNEVVARTEEPEFDLHVNFWSLEDIKTSDQVNIPYLDIGIKIKNYSLLENIVFYCPFVLEENSIIDLSEKMGTKNNANIIFNADCEIQTKDSYTIVNLVEKSEELLVFPLKQVIKNVYEVIPLRSGTQLLFKFDDFQEYVKGVDKLKALDTIYLRFRINNPVLRKQIYFDSEPINKSFESAFSGTRIVDFKVNEKRNIDEKVKAEVIVTKQEWACFENIHFLIMVPSSYDLTSFYKEPMTCRELEDGLWDDYLETEIDFGNGHVLAYHWRGKAENGKKIEDFSCLVKVNYSRARKSTIAVYAMSVVWLGIISSMIVAILQKSLSEAAYLGVATILIVVLGLGILAYIGNGKKR